MPFLYIYIYLAQYISINYFFKGVPLLLICSSCALICLPHTSFPACMVSGALLPKALWQFGNMISCVQPGVSPLKYNDYGCWCGLGGKGSPRDEVDM